MVNTLWHINTIDTTLPRNKFTHHGLHLKTLGQERIMKLLGQNITNSLTRQNNLLISLPMKLQVPLQMNAHLTCFQTKSGLQEDSRGLLKQELKVFMDHH
jgi:hypothetical protein